MIRITKPGRLQSGAQTVAVPARNTGTAIPARRGGFPTVPLSTIASSQLPLTVQRQGFTHPIKKQGY